MRKSETSFFAFSRKTLFIFGAVLFLAASGFVAKSTNAQNRVIRASSIATAGGVESQLAVSILLDSQGNESSTSFSLNFNPFVLTNLVVGLGLDAPADSNLRINRDNVTEGRLGVSVDYTNSFAAGTRNIVTIIFTVPAGSALSGIYPVAFGSVPTPQSVLSSTGEPLPTTYEQGFVGIGTADGVGVSGRILTPDGRGISNVTVTVTGEYGDRRFATTSSFGYYTIPYVRLGATYTFSVRSKRYRFAARVIQIEGILREIDFVGQQ